MSRLFDISSTERSFLQIFAFVGPIIYALTGLGLYYRVPIAGFVAWFVFIGPGVAEFTHFIFPLLTPALNPTLDVAITARVSNGHLVADMPNYWIVATGRYYFPGLYTAVLPMIPGLYSITRLARRRVGSIGHSAYSRLTLQPIIAAGLTTSRRYDSGSGSKPVPPSSIE